MVIYCRVDPKYPPAALRQRIEGTVRFEAVIGKDGHIERLRLVSGHPLLVRAAREAAQHWVYRPTLLRGKPVRVVTIIEVQLDPLVADVAAYALRQVDRVAGELGTPVSLSSYRPYHSSGEDFLCDMVGMIGIPVEMYPDWAQAKTVLLTEAAKYDPGIVLKIEQHLRAGDNVVISSGLLRALEDQGMNQITDIRLTGHVLAATSYVAGFGSGAGSELAGSQNAILFPEVHFYTNEDWAVVHGLAAGRGVPLLLMDKYGEGTPYVWTVPEDLNDLCRLPSGALDDIRRQLEPGLPVRLEGPAEVSLFTYDNDTFVVESYLDHPVAVRITGSFGNIQNLITGVTLTGDPVTTRFFPPRRSETAQAPRQYGFDLQIEPCSHPRAAVSRPTISLDVSNEIG